VGGAHLKMDALTSENRVKPRLSVRDIAFGSLSLLATLALCFVAIYYKDSLLDTGHLARYGLLGMLAIAFLSGSVLSMVAVPVPYWLLVFTLPPVLASKFGIGAPMVVGLISGVGASLGQLLTFVLGCGGRDMSQKLAYRVSKRFYDKAIDLARRHGSLAVFLMSAIINPLHLPMTLAIASLRYPSWKFFVFSLLGNIVKSSFIAFCGYFGLRSLFDFLGV
jgi:membrane protein YqaA with SNARE-associated domain